MATQWSTVFVLTLIMASLHTANCQNSANVQSGINIGLQVGVSCAIVLLLVFGLTGLINLIKYKIMPKTHKPV